MNTECNRIAHQLASTINGDAWYGDSLEKMLNDVTAKQAQARAIPSAHSIWELLCHVDAWVNFTLGAVQGVPIPAWPGMPVELDWPAVTDTSERAWKHAVDSFFSNAIYHAGQIALLKKIPPNHSDTINHEGKLGVIEPA